MLIAMEVEFVLEDAGAEVVGPSHTLADALDRAGREDISAAVLDLRLGPFSVIPVARKLAARGIPFVFYSGQLNTDPIRAEWPDKTVISKPAQPNQIVRAVTSLLHDQFAR